MNHRYLQHSTSKIHLDEETVIKALIKASIVGLPLAAFAAGAADADGFKNCTKIAKASWKPASDAEATAKSAGYEVRKSKVEGS